MLLHLSVKNYALIDNVSFNFDAGFTTITGETGAGKSIILGALGLLLGKRADVKNVDDKKCVIEGHFNLDKYNLKYFFDENDLDYEPIAILRREISPAGKSRAFVNDTPVKLEVLKNVSSCLIDIHSQHQNLLLENSDFQLSVVDAFCEHKELLEKYQKTFKEFKNLLKEVKLLEDRRNALTAENDYNKFVFNELETAAIDNGEIERIEENLKQQENVEEIKSVLFKVSQLLEGEDASVLNQLNEAVSGLNKISGFNGKYEEFANRVSQSYEDLRDLQPALEVEVDNLEYDPSEVNRLTERLNLLTGFLHKYNLQTTEDLLQFKESLQLKLNGTDAIEEHIDKVKKDLSAKETQLTSLGNNISTNRTKSFDKIASMLKGLIVGLGIKYGEIKINKLPFQEPKITGLEGVSFLFRANKGSAFGEIAEIASGGELARVMLSIKYLICNLTKLPTILFDEIDTGISGDIADKMAKMMLEMGVNMQVIAITHLPQIASKGGAQFLVYKGLEKNKTTTSIKKLSSLERVEEIAKMLSGDHVSEAALENARILLQSN